MKWLFGKIWLFWSAFVFALSWFIVFPLFFIVFNFFPAKKFVFGHRIAQDWSRVICAMVGVRTVIHGMKNVPPKVQLIYVFNHRSQIDVPVSFMVVDRVFSTIAKHSAGKIPVIGYGLKHLHIAVNRKDLQSRKQSLEKLGERIEMGHSIVVFPEGRRNRDKEALGKFYDGAFKLSKRFDLPVLPVTLVGSDKINNPLKPLNMFPGRIDVYYGKIIQPEENIEIQKENVRSVMLKHLNKV